MQCIRTLSTASEWRISRAFLCWPSTLLLKDAVASDDCFLIGCPSLPLLLTVNETADDGKYCEPVSFSFAGLKTAAESGDGRAAGIAGTNNTVLSAVLEY